MLHLACWAAWQEASRKLHFVGSNSNTKHRDGLVENAFSCLFLCHPDYSLLMSCFGCFRKVLFRAILWQTHNLISMTALESFWRLFKKFRLKGMLEATSQITFQRPCRKNYVVSLQWHNAFECEIMSIWGFSYVLIYFVFIWKPVGQRKEISMLAL